MWAEEPKNIPYLISDPPPNVAKRLKTLGNAVVPPQVYPILRYISDIETGHCQEWCVEKGGAAEKVLERAGAVYDWHKAKKAARDAGKVDVRER